MLRTIKPLAAAVRVVGLASGCAQPMPGHRMAGMQGMEMGADNTPGWAMMSPQERDEHHRKMMAAKSPAECRAQAEQHHREMAERAKARGMPMDMPKHDMCAMMQQGAAK
jgi:hypothetical protein